MASKKKIPSKRAFSVGPSVTSRFDLDWKDEDFEELKQGFVPLNIVTWGRVGKNLKNSHMFRYMEVHNGGQVSLLV